MFRLFFADKHALSELDLWLLPGLLGKAIVSEIWASILLGVERSTVRKMCILPSTLQ